jgi:hypothetical protein
LLHLAWTVRSLSLTWVSVCVAFFSVLQVLYALHKNRRARVSHPLGHMLHFVPGVYDIAVEQLRQALGTYEQSDAQQQEAFQMERALWEERWTDKMLSCTIYSYLFIFLY